MTDNKQILTEYTDRSGFEPPSVQCDRDNCGFKAGIVVSSYNPATMKTDYKCTVCGKIWPQ